MAIKAVNEHASETPRGPKPKYLVKRQTEEDRAAGRILQVKPYNAFLAAHPEWKGVHALPAEYVKRMAELNAKRDAQATSQKAYHDAFQAGVESRKAEFEKKLTKQRKSLKVGAAEEAAQADIDSESKPQEFVLKDASQDQLIAFAKQQFNVDLDSKLGADKLRAEVAKLSGIEAE